jgi:hypothetical protein
MKWLIAIPCDLANGLMWAFFLACFFKPQNLDGARADGCQRLRSEGCRAMRNLEAELRKLMRADRARQNQRRDRQELLDLEATEETGSAATNERMHRGLP